MSQLTPTVFDEENALTFIVDGKEMFRLEVDRSGLIDIKLGEAKNYTEAAKAFWRAVHENYVNIPLLNNFQGRA